MSEANDRRDFLKASLAASAAAGLAGIVEGADDAASKGLPTRALGKTGEKVSLLCLGGWHIGSVKDEKEAIRIMHAALDGGMTFFDNAWDYHDGGSELVSPRRRTILRPQEARSFSRDAKRSASATRSALRRR